jgi:tripartite-type tricarboxylate transporter receptor subunit TctC
MTTATGHRPSRRRITQQLAAAGTLLSTGLPAFAQSDATMKFIVPFPAGGAADQAARVLVEKLKDELKQNVIVENRAGASTRVAAEALKNAAPDGNTVLMTLHDTMVIAPMVYTNLRYDPAKDFAPIAELFNVTYAFAVNATEPYKTIAEYFAAVKADKNKGSMGTTGLGSSLHFLAFDLTKKSGVDLTIVPYQGGPAMVTNLLGGQIGSAIDGLGVFAEQHRQKKVRVLAVSGRARVSQLPEVPTLVESGFPSMTAGSGYALYAPAGTPEPQINRWNQAMRKVMAMLDVRTRLQTIGYEPVTPGTPAELVQLRTRLTEFWGPVVRATGYKSE